MNGAALTVLELTKGSSLGGELLYKLVHPTISHAQATEHCFPINLWKWITGSREMKQQLPRVALCVGGSSVLL